MKKLSLKRQKESTMRSGAKVSRRGLIAAGIAVLFMLMVLPLAYADEGEAVPLGSGTPSGQDRLVVKNDSGATTFAVEDIGAVFSKYSYLAQGGNPGFWLDEVGTGFKSAYFVLDNGWMQVQKRGQGFGGYEGIVMRFNIKAPHDSFRIEQSGNIGLGVQANTHPLQLKSGAHVTAGGAWTNASSRDYKQDIKELSVDEALAAFEDLKPMKFRYKNSPAEEQVGFIAEDVPELVATQDRKGMSPMDVVAVLTKVVQEQQKTMAAMSKRIEDLEKGSH